MTPSTPSGYFKQLLVCTDGSPDSEGAITASLELAKASGGKIFLLEILILVPRYEIAAPDLMPPVVDMELAAAQEKVARQRLEAWKAKATETGVELEFRIRTSGSAYEGILEEAGEINPDLIVMGRHGYSGLSRLLMGSVTARVIGHSPVNVLVAPQGVPCDFTKIMVASDGSPFSQAALEEALKLAKAMGSALIGVSVAASDQDIPAAQEIVRRMELAAASAGLGMDTLIPRGRADESIVKAAQFKQPGLLILGSHGRTGLKRLLLGSVAERVIGQAPCAVLVVKKK